MSVLWLSTGKVKGLLAGFEGPSCEDVGLLKLDILGIKMLDKIMDVGQYSQGIIE